MTKSEDAMREELVKSINVLKSDLLSKCRSVDSNLLNLNNFCSSNVSNLKNHSSGENKEQIIQFSMSQCGTPLFIAPEIVIAGKFISKNKNAIKFVMMSHLI